CVSYLSLPTDKQQPVPLVLMVHGGPNFRDFWGFNPIHQWLTNRGYAVLSVNYRASTGFGKAHAMAGNGEWGGKIQEDLLDAVAWAIEQGITQKEQVAIMGRSFGGYATLMALTQTPEVFCCGVDIVGPADLETMAANFPAYWKTMQGVINGMMLGCDPDTPEGKAFLAKRSPIHSVNKITKPLLIGHGANDVRVKQSESDHMVAAMQANGIPVTYAYFPDEGHQFMHPGNRMAFYALAEAFLANIFHGAVEPQDKKLHTSMVVKVDDFKLTK
ncbi:MAG TPA: prolyl oligopeptidase family serine peptidase, partial [Candidatus Berkiella sp.]|nr:prolyl oligopeptidase family serine peptidase [Candidatus Berkiella sp.]